MKNTGSAKVLVSNSILLFVVTIRLFRTKQQDAVLRQGTGNNSRNRQPGVYSYSTLLTPSKLNVQSIRCCLPDCRFVII
jgi:hypothetical protein